MVYLPAEIFLSFQGFLSMTKTEQMSLIDVKGHDFLKELI